MFSPFVELSCGVKDIKRQTWNRVRRALSGSETLVWMIKRTDIMEMTLQVHSFLVALTAIESGDDDTIDFIIGAKNARKIKEY